jgi:hypothetical protein
MAPADPRPGMSHFDLAATADVARRAPGGPPNGRARRERWSSGAAGAALI